HLGLILGLDLIHLSLPGGSGGQSLEGINVESALAQGPDLTELDQSALQNADEIVDVQVVGASMDAVPEASAALEGGGGGRAAGRRRFRARGRARVRTWAWAPGPATGAMKAASAEEARARPSSASAPGARASRTSSTSRARWERTARSTRACASCHGRSRCF